MRIKQLTRHAGPKGVFLPGQMRDCPMAEAQALIDGGYAVEVEYEAPKKEVAAVDPVEERAAEVTNPVRRRVRRRG